MEILYALLLIVVSSFVIAKACNGFEAASDYLGRNLSEGVKGASINAVGSSMPELFTTFVFLFVYANTTGFAGGIGTTAGSAVFNSMIIPALSILVAIRLFKLVAVEVSKKVILRDGLILLAAELLLIFIIGRTLHWWHGLALMAFYGAYMFYMFASMKGLSSEVEPASRARTELNPSARWLSLCRLDLEHAVVGNQALRTGNSWLLLITATVVIALACYALVLGCESLGHALGIDGFFVAVIIAAAASSIPDTILSIKDAKKGNYDDAVSNALGSNIFDICFALGLPLFLYALLFGSIQIDSETVVQLAELRILLFVLTLMVFLLFLFGRSLGKVKAYTLLGCYAIFVIYIVGRAYELPFVMPIVEGLKFIQSFLPAL